MKHSTLYFRLVVWFAAWSEASRFGGSLQVLCRRARCEVCYLTQKLIVILTPNPVATCLLRKLHYRRPSS